MYNYGYAKWTNERACPQVMCASERVKHGNGVHVGVGRRCVSERCTCALTRPSTRSFSPLR